MVGLRGMERSCVAEELRRGMGLHDMADWTDMASFLGMETLQGVGDCGPAIVRMIKKIGLFACLENSCEVPPCSRTLWVACFGRNAGPCEDADWAGSVPSPADWFLYIPYYPNAAVLMGLGTCLKVTRASRIWRRTRARNERSLKDDYHQFRSVRKTHTRKLQETSVSGFPSLSLEL